MWRIAIHHGRVKLFKRKLETHLFEDDEDDEDDELIHGPDSAQDIDHN